MLHSTARAAAPVGRMVVREQFQAVPSAAQVTTAVAMAVAATVEVTAAVAV